MWLLLLILIVSVRKSNKFLSTVLNKEKAVFFFTILRVPRLDLEWVFENVVKGSSVFHFDFFLAKSEASDA